METNLPPMDTWAWIFLVGGLLLVGSELIATSLVGVFLGVAALLVAGLRAVGIVDSVPLSFLAWAVISLALTVPLRPLARKWFTAGDVKRDTSDPETDREATGQLVEVVEAISDEADTGRIRFQGTTWQARSTEGRIAAGQQAQLVYRDNLVWIVEPVVPAELPARDLFAGHVSADDTISSPDQLAAHQLEKK